MNRFSQAIDRTRTKLEELPPEKIELLEENCKIDFQEHFTYQQTQARAHAMAKITTEEAQVLYNALGECQSQNNGGWTKDTDLATKIIVTQVIGELLEMRL